MISKTLIVGIIVILMIAGIVGYFLMQKPSITPTGEVTVPEIMTDEEINSKPSITPTGEVTVPEIMTDEEINSLTQSVEDIEAIESELNITEMDLNIDLE